MICLMSRVFTEVLEGYRGVLKKSPINDRLFKYASELIVRNTSLNFRSSHRRCSAKKVFLEILQNSRENTCVRVYFLESSFCKVAGWSLAYMLFFSKQPFFSTQPQCCLTFLWIELQILLGCWLIHNHHYAETHFIFSMFVSMSRPRCNLCRIFLICISFFSLIFITINPTKLIIKKANKF